MNAREQPFLAALLFVVVLFLTGCAGSSAAGVAPASPAVTATAVPSPTRTPLPTLTATPVPPTADVSAYLEMDLSGGDPQQGFNVAVALECRPCHESESNPDRAPRLSATGELPPVMERGDLRLADPAYEGQATTGYEYLLESIFVPQAYAAPGAWTLTMPEDYAQRITAEDLAHLLAWLQTLGDVAEPPTATPES